MRAGNRRGRSCRVFTDHRSIPHWARTGRAAAASAASTASVAAAATARRSFRFRATCRRRTRAASNRDRARRLRPARRSLPPLAMRASRARTGRSRRRTRHRRGSRWLDAHGQFPLRRLPAARSCGTEAPGVRLAARPQHPVSWGLRQRDSRGPAPSQALRALAAAAGLRPSGQRLTRAEKQGADRAMPLARDRGPSASKSC